MSSEDIRKLLAQNKLVFGEERAIKELSKNNLSAVIVASNADDAVVDRLRFRSTIAGVEFTQLDLTNSEIGVLCRRPHPIAVVSVLK